MRQKASLRQDVIAATRPFEFAVPIRRAGMRPDKFLMGGINLVPVVEINLLPDFDRRGLRLCERVNITRRVLDLVYDNAEHAAAMAGTDIGTEQNEKIGKARNERSEISGNIVALPELSEHAPITSDYVIRAKHVGRLEPGSGYQHIGFDLLSVPCDQCMRDKMHVGFAQCAVPTIPFGG